jgi:hypothetical protein
MATTTATVFIWHANQGYFIELSENDRPCLTLHVFDTDAKTVEIIPTVENTADDIFLMISKYILNTDVLQKDFFDKKHGSLYEIFTDEYRHSLYKEIRSSLKDIKVVFNLLDDCMLLKQIEQIKQYACDFEITTTTVMQEYSAWTQKIFHKGFLLYFAYGSNLNKKQMKKRCEYSEPDGSGILLDYQIVFQKHHGRKDGVLTIEPKAGSKVPIGIYTITAKDEARLDVHEGVAKQCYKKQKVTIKKDDNDVEGLIYIMIDGINSKPTNEYYNTVLTGYKEWNFDEKYLKEAARRSGFETT